MNNPQGYGGSVNNYSISDFKYPHFSSGRAIDGVYQNVSDKPIWILIRGAGLHLMIAISEALLANEPLEIDNSTVKDFMSGIIPPGWYYQVIVQD